MIGKSTLKKYEFKRGIFEYYEYLVESQINGNHAQVRELFKKLSEEQKKEFFMYLKHLEIKFDYTGLL